MDAIIVLSVWDILLIVLFETAIIGMLEYGLVVGCINLWRRWKKGRSSENARKKDEGNIIQGKRN